MASWNFHNMFNCDCSPEVVDSDDRRDTVVFWQSSAQCCSHLRFTIWLVYVILFLLMAAFIYFKMNMDNRNFQERLSNFAERASTDDRDHDFSSVGSIRDPFIN